MNSKQIFYRNTGHDNETYIFLDKLDNGSYQVRAGNSSPVSHFEWEGDETIQTVEEFLGSNPSYAERVHQLISEFEAES
ncbi:hypothetical protein K6R57_000402 [Escherichia coli]|nr:hypothetical protein [Escherichia coli]EHZ8345330.1 hypothetical protein [Escherichia coli]